MGGLTEAQFQQQIIDLAGVYGWTVYHTFDSRHSTPGFPDLVLVRGTQLVFAELKTDTGRVRPEQTDWLTKLTTVAAAISAPDRDDGPIWRDDIAATTRSAAVSVHLWRPKDWTVIQEILRPRRRA